MQLFLVVLGGRSRGCHIEQHDVRFVAGERIEDTLPELRRQWFGLQRGLHLDSWQRISEVEGWRVVLRREPFSGPQRLWFVNVGAYDPACAWELHAFGLFVATSARAAAARAKRHLLVGVAQQHKDDVCSLEALGDRLPSAVSTRPSTSTTAPERRGLDAAADATADVDDARAIERLGDWQVHLVPPAGDAPAEQTAWRPLRPDWFGYRRIDRDQDPADGTGSAAAG